MAPEAEPSLQAQWTALVGRFLTARRYLFHRYILPGDLVNPQAFAAKLWNPAMRVPATCTKGSTSAFPRVFD